MRSPYPDYQALSDLVPWLPGAEWQSLGISIPRVREPTSATADEGHSSKLVWKILIIKTEHYYLLAQCDYTYSPIFFLLEVLDTE